MAKNRYRRTTTSTPSLTVSEAPRLLSPLAFYWSFGLAAFFMAVGALLFPLIPLSEERYEWGQYLLLGTLFPLAALGVHRFGNGRLKIILGCFALIASVALFTQIFSAWAVAGAITQYLVMTYYLKINVSHRVEFYTITLLAWTIALKLLWWMAPSAWFTHSWLTPISFILSLGIGCLGLFGEPKPSSEKNLTIIAFAAFALGSSRVAFDLDAEFLIGSASLIRQGGWLLWDTPSQYGFLNLLTVAFAPFDTVWEALYIVNSTLIFASTCIVFLLLKKLGRGSLHTVFSAMLAYSMVLMMSGYVVLLIGPNSLPSVAAFRFIWCYVLLYWSQRENTGTRLSLWIGSAIWLIGVMWSFESAIFTSVIWLPTLVVLGSWRWLAVPALSLSAVVGLVTMYYQLRLGHAPDFKAFYEYALSYQGQGAFGSMPIQWDGSVWVLVMAFLLLAHSILEVFGKDRVKTAALLAGTGTIWATASYFISRSHENNLGNLVPLMGAGILVSLNVFAKDERFTRSFSLIRAAFLPMIVVIGTITWGNANLGKHLSSIAELRTPSSIHKVILGQSDSLFKLLFEAKVTPESSIVLLHRNMLNTTLPEQAPADMRAHPPRYWLPLAPAGELGVLPPARQRVYIERFIARRPMSGWVLHAKLLPYGPLDPKLEASLLASVLSQTHVMSRHLENEAWKLEWFELKGAVAERR